MVTNSGDRECTPIRRFPGPLSPAKPSRRYRGRMGMSKNPKERIIGLGNIVTGFTNEEYPDDAVRSYFENLSSFLGLSASSQNKIDKLFPYLDDFEDSLSLLDKELFVCVIEEERIKKFIDNQLSMIFKRLDRRPHWDERC